MSNLHHYPYGRKDLEPLPARVMVKLEEEVVEIMRKIDSSVKGWGVWALWWSDRPTFWAS